MASYPLMLQRRRQHTIIQLANFETLSAASWQRQGLRAFVRDLAPVHSVLGLSPIWARVVPDSLTPAASASSRSLLVLADDALTDAGLDQLAVTTAPRVLWLTSSAQSLLGQFAILRQAQTRNDVLVLDLDDPWSGITWQSQLLMGDGDCAHEVSLLQALQDASYVSSGAEVGIKRDVELARRLVSVLASDALYDSVIALGVYHPIVRRVRLLRERWFVQSYSSALPKRTPSQLEHNDWLTREVKRLSKRWSISIECARQVLSKEWGLFSDSGGHGR